MTNNDLLRRLRYALNLNGVTMTEIFALAGYEIGPAEALKFLKKEEEQGFVACDDAVMGYFLDGLIVYRRGRQGQPTADGLAAAEALTNNLILRKLRIALELNDEAMIEILKLAGVVISKSQLSAMFRSVEHRNYKQCGDQFLRNFIRGLTLGQKQPQKNNNNP
ncbi:MAG: DUF1456 family protein [Deltaproteobacteria bacterium]|nr:DUF1456 family protein [Deltaproteobacteria bacterium]TLN04408.1 MAG: DUF1456 family protein [bacterium]